MNITTVLGLVFGFGMLITGYLIEGGSIGALFLLSPAIIVFGGTAGTILVSFNLEDIQRIPIMLKDCFTSRKSSEDEIIEFLVKLSEVARREGLLSLEENIENSNAKNMNPMIVDGIKLIVDGTDPELVKNMLETKIMVKEHVRKTDISIFEAAGGYSPTMGIIGTVMGLVFVLGNLSDPSELSKSIAAAFIATLYGVAFANVVYLPLGSKLKQQWKKELAEAEMIVEGVLSIQAGENPGVVRAKLTNFKHDHGKHKAAPEAKEE